MEMSQGNSLCSCFKQAKMPFFLSSTKSKNRRMDRILSRGLIPVRGGKVVGKGCRRVNKVKIVCTYVCKCKNDTCSNYSRKRGWIKENGGGSEFKHDIFDTL
jgi:hypothetical protein